MHTITITADAFEPVIPNESEVRLAGSTSQRLAAILKKNSASSIQVLEKGQEERLDLPTSAARLLVSALEEISKGHSITLVAMEEEITTSQAADLLNVSRPYLIDLLEKNAIPNRKVGTHRRIRFEDLKAYKDHIDAERRKVLAELTAEAQELGMGY